MCNLRYNFKFVFLIFFRCNVIPTLSDILSETVKEKVTRIILATFKVFFIWRPCFRSWKFLFKSVRLHYICLVLDLMLVFVFSQAASQLISPSRDLGYFSQSCRQHVKKGGNQVVIRTSFAVTGQSKLRNSAENL